MTLPDQLLSLPIPDAEHWTGAEFRTPAVVPVLDNHHRFLGSADLLGRPVPGSVVYAASPACLHDDDAERPAVTWSWSGDWRLAEDDPDHVFTLTRILRLPRPENYTPEDRIPVERLAETAAAFVDVLRQLAETLDEVRKLAEVLNARPDNAPAPRST